jgi:pimeloyl-ACP methyl ester carboxylesterase
MTQFERRTADVWRVLRSRPATTDGYVERDGVRTFYEVFGSGAVTILVLPTWSALHAAHGRFQIADLARHFRVVTFDGRGNGRSDRPSGSEAYAEQEFVADAVAVLDATGTDRAVVIGCSLATFWLLRLAAEHPDRVLAGISTGTNLPLAAGHPRPSQAVPFQAPYTSTEGWAKFNAAYIHEQYEDFLRFFFEQVWTEPHSRGVIEDSVTWGLETTPQTLIDTALAPGIRTTEEALELASRVRCPMLVMHGREDAVTPMARSVTLAEVTHGRLVILEGSGHCSANRDPFTFNQLVREFIESIVAGPAPPEPGSADPGRKRVLFAPQGHRPEAVLRDVAIAEALRALRPDLCIVWLAPPSIRSCLEAKGERVHPASDALLAEHGSPRDVPPPFAPLTGRRRNDEALFVNFMVFHDIVVRERIDLVIADGAWQIDHYLHEHPELKRFAYAWLTDSIGWSPASDDPIEAALAVDANAEMLDLVDRHPSVRDRALFLGSFAQLPTRAFGPGLPEIRAWSAERFSFDDEASAAQGQERWVASVLAPLI